MNDEYIETIKRITALIDEASELVDNVVTQAKSILESQEKQKSLDRIWDCLKWEPDVDIKDDN